MHSLEGLDVEALRKGPDRRLIYLGHSPGKVTRCALLGVPCFPTVTESIKRGPDFCKLTPILKTLG